ncbi:MAG: YbjN domain-containing protein [Alphaproteobacteria bacterium]
MRARLLGGLIVTAALGGCVTGGASPTGMIEQVSPDLIAGILDTYHVDHRVSVGDDGNPMIVVASGPEIPAAQMFVRFHDCDAARACESLTLWSWYADTGEADSDAINRWNREARSTRAMVEGEHYPALQMDINAAGGIGQQALVRQIGFYLDSMETFAAAMRGA